MTTLESQLRTLTEENVKLLKQRELLLDALDLSDHRLQSIISGPLSIDNDFNRTPERLAIRKDVIKTLDAIRQALSKTQPESGHE